MKYDYQVSLRKKKKFLKKVYILIIGLFVIALLIVGLIRLDAYLLSRQNTPDQTTTEKTNSYFAPTTKIFRSKYFQFQTENDWTEISSETTENKFVYRGQNKAIIEQELTIYVDHIPDDLAATRILPIKLKDNNQLVPTAITGHCNETVGGFKTNNQRVTFKGVTLDCDIDNTQYNVLVGQIGGTTKLTLTRPDGTNIAYSLYYRNVKAVPNANELVTIVSSFQTR